MVLVLTGSRVRVRRSWRPRTRGPSWRRGWRLVAWVSAENTGSLLSGLAAVADALGLSDGGSGRARLMRARWCGSWLEADGDRCLLVFDAAEDPEALGRSSRRAAPRGC